MKHEAEADLLRIGITMGDINGVGPELIVKTFMEPLMMETCIPIVYGSSRIVSYYKKSFSAEHLNYQNIASASQALPKRLNIINCWEEEAKIEPGVSNATGANYAVRSLEKATSDLTSNNIHALVTSPIDKSHMSSVGFDFPGHTEYMAAKAKGVPLMLMVGEDIRVALATGHMGLKDVSTQLTIQNLFDKITILDQSLKLDFSIDRPKIAVLAVNPHASDQGKFGNEEAKIIQPAIQKAFNAGIIAVGPFSADGFFASGNYVHYDAILAMYHDQGLIPFKAITGMAGINYTAGLNIIRTSPDHGPAFDIAGQGKASEDSFRNAVYMAIDIYRTRYLNRNLSKNKLKNLSTELTEGQDDEALPESE